LTSVEKNRHLSNCLNAEPVRNEAMPWLLQLRQMHHEAKLLKDRLKQKHGNLRRVLIATMD